MRDVGGRLPASEGQWLAFIAQMLKRVSKTRRIEGSKSEPGMFSSLVAMLLVARLGRMGGRGFHHVRVSGFAACLT